LYVFVGRFTRIPVDQVDAGGSGAFLEKNRAARLFAVALAIRLVQHALPE
jgi:hypothetical protein